MRSLTLLALALLPSLAAADTFRQRTVTVTRGRAVAAPVVVRQTPVVVQQAPVVVQAAPVVVRQPVYAAPQLQFAPAPACAAGSCLSPSQAAALRAAQLRALGY